MPAKSRWTTEDREAIRCRVANGETQRAIAESLGTRQQEICRVINGRKDKPLTAEGKAKVKANHLAWRKRNMDRVRSTVRLMQHKLRGAGEVALKDWEDIVSMFDGRCAYCGVKDRMTIEHVIPFCKGGRHEADNVVPACGSCNFVKGKNGPLSMVNRNFQLRVA